MCVNFYQHVCMCDTFIVWDRHHEEGQTKEADEVKVVEAVVLGLQLLHQLLHHQVAQNLQQSAVRLIDVFAPEHGHGILL